MSDVDYRFDGPADARMYLREVGALWAVWLVGLVAVLLTHGAVLLIGAAVLLVALLVLARPLLPRTEALVPENRTEGGKVETALRGGTTRDRVLRELAYGDAPMSAALEAAGFNRRWIVVRHLVIALTLLAFGYVVVVPLL
jgi:hypothetical protein